MERYEVGMLARSKAGHDKGHVYVIFEVDEAYVYLVDGSIRTMDKPKKKKKKHVQIICEKHELSKIDDVGIKRILKLFDKETGGN
ncbi:MAG: KOW domain-containing RNA-binding protein [Tyzzerella sp.]|nr:KOW domain-containing RNA-binding protein [Tyzzerella sp.]